MIHMKVSWSFLKCGLPHFIIHLSLGFSTLNQRINGGSPMTIIVYGNPRPARITGHLRYPSHRRWLLRCMWPNSSGTSSALGVAKVLWACGNTRTKQFQRISGLVRKNRMEPKWMVHNEKYYSNGWFGGTSVLGNIHFITSEIVPVACLKVLNPASWRP